MNNETLWEHFEFKTIKRSVKLATFNGKEMKWLSDVSTNLYERRGDFENITLLAMTEAELAYIELPKNLASIANISKVIPDTYEVRLNSIFIINYRT